MCLRLAEDIRKRIRADRKRASVKVAQLLDVIDRMLLDPDLTVDSLLRECGQRNKNVLTQFAIEIGVPPWAYILEARMEIAARMLAESDCKVWVIGMHVGYPHRGSFSRAFTKWSGKSPKAFRADAQSSDDETPEPADEDVLSVEELQQAIDGDLPADQAEALAARLFKLGDRIQAQYQAPGARLAAARAVESTMARNLWQLISNQPHEIQKRAIESQAPAYRTACLFNRLSSASVAATDPTRGMQLANLAILALQAAAGQSAAEAPNVHALAWAVAGYAMERAGELDDAERYFHVATRILEHIGDAAHPLVVAQLCFFQTPLELERGRTESAEKLMAGGKDILFRFAERVAAQLSAGAAEA